ncbi:MAG: hypothetical protein R6X35_12525 [Candidatus Krumholzibacteriia bacterium]
MSAQTPLDPPVPAAPGPNQAAVRPSDPSPATRNLVRLVQTAGEQPERLAADLAAHLADQPNRMALAADLRAVVGLAADRHPAADALVRALVATAPAGHRLLAAARTFGSTRRLGDGSGPAPEAGWAARRARLAAEATGPELPLVLRGRCDALLAGLMRGGAMPATDRDELAALLTLEADARDERVRDLAARAVARGVDAGTVRLEQVARLDAGLHDLRDLIARLAADGGRADIVAPHNRFLRALGADGRRRVEEALSGAADLERLALVWRGLSAAEPALPDPESAWLRLRALAASPAAELVLPSVPDPLGLAALVVACGMGGAVRLPLVPQARERLAAADAPALPEGITVQADELVIACDDAFRARAPRPAAEALAEAEAQDEDEPAKDQGASALKRLVLTNLQSTSVTIAFLRDSKVVAVPGLVEEVVNRTRNPQIIEIIATQRPLHGGFANRGVPLALLRSPVNVSTKLLRKFIHVKYISKMDLRRLANDRTGIRREVGKEIEQYLSSLA